MLLSCPCSDESVCGVGRRYATVALSGATQRLFRAGLALSVTFGATSPKGRGFGMSVRSMLDERSTIWRKRAGLATEGRPVFVQPLRHRLRDATSPCRGGFGSPRKVNGFARGSPTRGAVERSETERLYEGKPDREPLQRRFTQVWEDTAAPRGAGYLAKFQNIIDSSSQIELCHVGKLKACWQSR